MGTIHVVGAAIASGGRCLVAQRGPSMALAGKWEFPGGKVEARESPTDALVREVREELALEVTVGSLLGTGTAQAGDRTIELAVYGATVDGGELALREHAQARWATPEELGLFDWAEADVPIVPAVRRWLASLSS